MLASHCVFFDEETTSTTKPRNTYNNPHHNTTTKTPTMSHTWRTTTADSDPLLPGSTYTELARLCRHTIHHTSAQTLTSHLPPTIYNPLTSHPTTLTCTSATILLCRTCESALRAELAGARRAFNELSARENELTEADRGVYEAAIGRFKSALMAVANFEGERERALAGWNFEARGEEEERVARWEKGRRVRFAVEVGQGAGGGGEEEDEEAGDCYANEGGLSVAISSLPLDRDAQLSTALSEYHELSSAFCGGLGLLCSVVTPTNPPTSRFWRFEEVYDRSRYQQLRTTVVRVVNSATLVDFLALASEWFDVKSHNTLTAFASSFRVHAQVLHSCHLKDARLSMEVSSTTTSAMAQQTPTMPTVVASTCHHRLTGGDPPAESASILAVTITHCASCKPYIATVCHHIVPGTISRVDRPSNSTLCPACTDFINVSKKLLATRWKREAFTSKTVPSKRSPNYNVWYSEWKGLTDAYNLARIDFANSAAYHYDHDDPEYPTVNKRGTALLPTKSSSGAFEPWESVKSATPKRVAFDETLEHPTRETGRRHLSYKRRATVYVPGKYADKSGNSFWNTSNPIMDWGEGLQEFFATMRDAPKAPKSADESIGMEAGARGDDGNRSGEQTGDSTGAFTEDDDAEDANEQPDDVGNAIVDVMADIISNILSIDELDDAEDDAKDNGDAEDSQNAYTLASNEDTDVPDNASSSSSSSSNDTDDSDALASKALIKALRRTKASDEDPALSETDTWSIGDSYTPDEATLKGLKRSRFEEERQDIGPFQTKAETFAIKILTLEEAMPPPYTATGPYKNTGWTMPVSERSPAASHARSQNPLAQRTSRNTTMPSPPSLIDILMLPALPSTPSPSLTPALPGQQYIAHACHHPLPHPNPSSSPPIPSPTTDLCDLCDLRAFLRRAASDWLALPRRSSTESKSLRRERTVARNTYMRLRLALAMELFLAQGSEPDGCSAQDQLGEVIEVARLRASPRFIAAQSKGEEEEVLRYLGGDEKEEFEEEEKSPAGDAPRNGHSHSPSQDLDKDDQPSPPPNNNDSTTKSSNNNKPKTKKSVRFAPFPTIFHSHRDEDECRESTKYDRTAGPSYEPGTWASPIPGEEWLDTSGESLGTKHRGFRKFYVRPTIVLGKRKRAVRDVAGEDGWSGSGSDSTSESESECGSGSEVDDGVDGGSEGESVLLDRKEVVDDDDPLDFLCKPPGEQDMVEGDDPLDYYM
ncbi:hypothetical protein Q7P37_009000 [Cladosporium fusiforme]